MPIDEPIVTRFAPSPTGRLHAGNIFASLMAWLLAKKSGGKVVLRIEDIDAERSHVEFAEQIMRDYERLGLFWDGEVVWQHNRLHAYQEAFEALCDHDLVYPCFCTRADLRGIDAPHWGMKSVYPGTCRHLSGEERLQKEQTVQPSYRVCVDNVQMSLSDGFYGAYSQNLASECGDFLVKRSDGLFAYQLAVVCDDAYQGVNTVVRGVDLLSSSPQQMFLTQTLGLPTCAYYHVPLLCNEAGKRLSKRDKAAYLDELLGVYKTPERVLGRIAYVSGIAPVDEALSASELLSIFDYEAYKCLLSQGFAGSQVQTALPDTINQCPVGLLWKSNE